MYRLLKIRASVLGRDNLFRCNDADAVETFDLNRAREIGMPGGPVNIFKEQIAVARNRLVQQGSLENSSTVANMKVDLTVGRAGVDDRQPG